MQSLGRAVGFVAIALSAVVLPVLGCDALVERYPSPAGGPNIKGKGIDGGGVVSLDHCECTAALGINPMAPESCATCFNTSVAFAPDPCFQPGQNCINDQGCLAIAECLSNCKYEPACLDECILPFDKDGAHELYFAVLNCSCDVCKDKCQYTAQITCDDLGTGGAGGGGGADAGP